jgi:hypothetical protein
MAKFGTFKFGTTVFGTAPANNFMPNRSARGIPLGIIPTKSLSLPELQRTFQRDWRNGVYHRSDKSITFQHEARDPATGLFTTENQVIVKHAYHRPIQPDTAAQLSRRSTFSAGVTAAQALTPTQKLVYKETASKKKAQTWFTVFMTEYLKSH